MEVLVTVALGNGELVAESGREDDEDEDEGGGGEHGGGFREGLMGGVGGKV